MSSRIPKSSLLPSLEELAGLKVCESFEDICEIKELPLPIIIRNILSNLHEQRCIVAVSYRYYQIEDKKCCRQCFPTFEATVQLPTYWDLIRYYMTFFDFQNLVCDFCKKPTLDYEVSTVGCKCE